MKKIISLLLVLVLCLSLCACGSGNSDTPDTPETTETTALEEVKLSKDEMLDVATPLTKEEIDKSISNVAFAKSLIGNTYTFGGEVFSIAEDYAVITFYITDEQGAYGTAANVMVANLYLPLEELISLENQQCLSFVGQLDDVNTHDETIPDWGTQTVVDLVFKSVAVVSDRFEATGKLHSQNASYGENAWNIKFSNSDYLSVVHFRDDVHAYKGHEITYSYKITSDGCVDAYIVE